MNDWARRMMRVSWGVRLAGVLLCVLVGCKAAQNPAANKPEEHPVRGRVVAIDAANQRLELDHEAIPGFMEAMDMEYKVDDPAVLTEVHPGDRITATLLVDRDAAGPKNMRLHNVVVIAQARPDYKPRVSYHVPQAGEEVPDFRLLNQSGRTLHLRQFRGKVVAMTFIYTRCAQAEFCPLMSRNFAELEQALGKDATLAARTHLLSVSFDPAYDTPKILRSYGGGVTGRYTQETFAHWDFAAPQGAELGEMEKWFDVGVTGGGAMLSHSLATTVIGKDGRVIAFYPTKDWSVAGVLAQMKQAAL